MIFSSPPWVQPVAQQAPDSIPVGDFVLARKPAAEDKAPFLDALSGHSYSIETLQSRVDNLARGLAHDLDWSPNTGSPWDKVVAIHSLNTVSILYDWSKQIQQHYEIILEHQRILILGIMENAQHVG